MIPLFPEFKHIEISDKQEIHELISKYPAYEDFDFVNLWSWDIEDDLLLSKLNENLVVKFHDYSSSNHFYSFIGSHNVKNTIWQLLEISIGKNIFPYLKLIPEEVILSDDTLYNDFSVLEDRDNFDYIMSLNELSQLPGKKYLTKRRNLNKFIRSNPNIKVQILDLKNPYFHSQIIDTFEIWRKNKNPKDEESSHELHALKKLLSIADKLKLCVIGIYNTNSMVGFGIVEIVHDNYAIGHFMKADPTFKGIYEFFYKMLADELLLLGCSYLNIQQDLGIEDLRKGKQLWHPSYFLKKYIISKKII